MRYDFDTVIDRKGTSSVKHDFAVSKGKPEGVIPLWVADMDFPAPQEVTEAIIQRCRHGIFGYSDLDSDYFPPIRDWYQNRFGWQPQEEWLVPTPGVIFALSCAVRSLTEPGDSVLIQQPVYHPFHNVIVNNGRKLVNSPLLYQNGKYTMDFVGLEEKIIQHQVKLLLLCSPHNPVGRVWTREELEAVGDICLRHGVIVVADEIHGDFVWEGHRHTVFASIKEEFAQNCLVCTAPSKTFNLAGLQASNIFIPNPEIRGRFCQEMDRIGCTRLNLMGILACKTAYAHGAGWLEQVKEYLWDNAQFVREYLQTQLPQISMGDFQGTYLLWLDFSRLGMTDQELEDFLLHKAGLWMDPGTKFGQEGSGFQRMNIACSRQVLRQAMDKLKQALEEVQ